MLFGVGSRRRVTQVENPFLEPYYKDPKKYALPMQLWLLKQRFVTYVKAIKYCLSTSGSTKGVILDRSVWCVLAAAVATLC